MQQKNFSLNIPSINAESPKSIEFEQSLIIMGANGSGKTKLGRYLNDTLNAKNPAHQKVLFFLATKSIEMPYGFGIMPERSINESYFRNSNGNRGKNDFQEMFNCLMADRAFKANECFEGKGKSEAKIDQVIKLWRKILPHINLGIDYSTHLMHTKSKMANSQYQANEMSDGERVIFYIIGQIVLASEQSLIIFDEPEIHLNKSIISDLYSELEMLRPDCYFIYLTHDIDFACSKPDVKKIWLKGYTKNENREEKWDFEEIQPTPELPDELILKILGRRKPVLFIEGKENSPDMLLYSILFEDFLVIPSKDCENVINLVKAFGKNEQLHYLDSYGLIDRDRRNKEEIENLNDNNVYVLEVAEIENVLCVEEVLEFICKKMSKDTTEIIKIIKAKIFKSFQENLDNQIFLHSEGELRYNTKKRLNTKMNKEALKSNLTKALVTEDEFENIFLEKTKLFQSVIDDRDYKKLLKIYNNKGIVKEILPELNIRKDLPNQIIEWAKNDENDKQKILNAIKPYLGGFENILNKDQ